MTIDNTPYYLLNLSPIILYFIFYSAIIFIKSSLQSYFKKKCDLNKFLEFIKSSPKALAKFKKILLENKKNNCLSDNLLMNIVFLEQTDYYKTKNDSEGINHSLLEKIALYEEKEKLLNSVLSNKKLIKIKLL